MPLITEADINARLGVDAALKLLDRDGDGSADPAVLEDADAFVQGTLGASLAASHPTLVLDGTVEVPAYIRSLAIDLVIGRVATAYPGWGGQQSPYAALYQDALSRLKMLRTDTGARLPTGPGEPYAGVDAGVFAPDLIWDPTKFSGF